jgi:dephospho-CoA kinase
MNAVSAKDREKDRKDGEAAVMKNTVMAVTGDVGAGKSTVAKLFEALGGILIDADRVVADLWRTEEVSAAAVGRWGKGILDGAGRVVHRAVADRIFAESGRAEYDWLSRFLQPRIRKELDRRVGLLGVGEWGVAEIPLLFETGPAPWVTVKVFVTAQRAVRAARCRARGWDEAEMARRESFFMPSEERMALSDHVVHNDAGLDALRKTVERIYNGLLSSGRAGY